MTNADAKPPNQAPTRAQLLRTTLLALGVAGVLLLLFVLPAEYGIDPTGVGRALGIDGLGAQDAFGEAGNMLAAPSGSSLISTQKPRSEQLEVPVAAGEEMELKMVMQEGQTLIFSWTSTAPLYSDLHADPFGGFEGEDIRYQEDEAIAESNGAVVAPFGGNHGWYWRNDGGESVTVSLELRGFFGAIKELRADTPR